MLSLDISNSVISKYLLISKNIGLTNVLFYLHFNSSTLKLLIFQRKFSRIRKFTFRYEQFGMNFDFEISRVDCMLSELEISGDF